MTAKGNFQNIFKEVERTGKSWALIIGAYMVMLSVSSLK
jgi:hypothetical protein